MNIKKLKKGDVFKNYKVLCEALELKVATGKQKQIQMQELQRFVKLHKEGNKIIIDEIHKDPTPKLDKRSLGNNNKQSRCISYLLMKTLESYNLKSDEIIGFSKGVLLKNIKLINSNNYRNAKLNRKKYANKLQVDKLAVDECIEYVDSRAYKKIKKAIDSLENQCVIGYTYGYTWVDSKGVYHFVNDSELCNIIREAEYHSIEELTEGIASKKYIYKIGKWLKFKYLTTKYLKTKYKESFKDLDFYYSSFNFTYNIDDLKKHIEKFEKLYNINVEIAEIELQSLWSSSLDKTISYYHNKQKNEVAFGEGGDLPAEQLERYRASDRYIPEVSKVKNTVIDSSREEIKLD